MQEAAGCGERESKGDDVEGGQPSGHPTGSGTPGLGLVRWETRLGVNGASRTPKASSAVPPLVPVPLALVPLSLGPVRLQFPHPAASQPTTATAMATATLWNFQFSANVQVVTEAQRPWSDIMAEEL